MEEWQKAKERGERACDTMNQHQAHGVHDDRQLLLRCLRALEPVYEAVRDEEKLYELVKKVRIRLPPILDRGQLPGVNISLTLPLLRSRP